MNNSRSTYPTISQLIVPVSDLLKEQRDAAAESSQPNSEDAMAMFCTLDNFESAVVYLSREIQGIGLGNLNITNIPQKTFDPNERFSSFRGVFLNLDLVCLINRCWETVQLYRSSVRDSSTLKEQRRQDVVINNKLQLNVTELQSSREENHRKLLEAIEQKRQAVESKNSLDDVVRKYKEEVKQLKSVLQQRDNQMQHELRKQDQYIHALKDRLVQLLSVPGSIVEKRMDLTAPLPPKEDKPRAKWNTVDNNSRHSNEMYRKVVAQYESWVYDITNERDALLGCLQSISAALQNLVKKHAKVMTPEEMAASMTDSVYSTDSLDEPVHQSNSSVNAAPLDALSRHCSDSILQLSVMLTEKATGDLREARVKRIHELTADAMVYSNFNKNNTNKENKNSDNNTHSAINNTNAEFVKRTRANEDNNTNSNDQSSHDDSINEKKKLAIIQLVKHLGIGAALGTEAKPPLNRRDNTETPKVASERESQTPIVSSYNNSPQIDSPNIVPPSTSTPDLAPLPSPHTPNTPSIMSEGGSTPGGSWLQRAGGPDDSTNTEVMNLKKLLEEERAAVKMERESFAEAALRLNRERASFEQEKLEILKQEFLQELPSNLKPENDIDASFYQGSRVPAWISEHHCRPFSPPLETSLSVAPNFTNPAGAVAKTETNTRGNSGGSSRDSSKTLINSGKNSAPSTRTPSVNRHSEHTTGPKSRTLPRSISSGSAVNVNNNNTTKSRRSPSISRLTVGKKDNQQQRKSGNSNISSQNSRYPFSRDSLRPNVKSHDCSRNNSSSRDSSLSRASSLSKNNKNSSSRFNSLPKNISSGTNKGLTVNFNSKMEFGSGNQQLSCNNSRNSTSKERDGILTRVSLPARQSCDTPPSRYGARKSSAPRNSMNHNTNSLPRQFGKTQPHLISSTNLSDKFEESRHAKSLESPAGSNNPDFNLPKGSDILAASKYSVREGIRRGELKFGDVRQKSNLGPLNKIMSQYSHLEVTGRPDDVFSVDSGYPVSESFCSGNCKKVLNISTDNKCLCHLLKKRNLEKVESSQSTETLDDANSEDFESVSVATDAQNVATNARINALEQSLLHLITKIEGRKSVPKSNDDDCPSDVSSSMCEVDLSKWKPCRSNSISEINPSHSYKNRHPLVNKRLSAGLPDFKTPATKLEQSFNSNHYKPSMKSKTHNGSATTLDAMFLEDHTQRHRTSSISPSASSLTLSLNDGGLKGGDCSDIDNNNLSDVTMCHTEPDNQ